MTEQRGIRDALEALATRGTPRGADEVLAAARSAPRRPRPLHIVVAAAAVVAVLAAGLAVRAAEGGDDGAGLERAGSPSPSLPTPPGRVATTTTTTEPRVVAVSESDLVLFDDCDDVVSTLRARAVDDVGPYGLPGLEYAMPVGPVAGGDAALGGTPDAAPGSAPVASPPPSTSRTNAQEAGIDEPDLVETDGRRVFVLRHDGGGPMVSVVALGASPGRTPGTRLPMASATGMMQVGDKLVVLGATNDRRAGLVSIVDVSGDPVVTHQLEVEGAIVDARAVGGTVQLVTRFAPVLDWTSPTSGSAEAQARAIATNRSLVQAASVDDWLADWLVRSATGETVVARPRASACNDTRHPQVFSGYSSTTLHTLDLDDLTASLTTSVIADSTAVYASNDNLYVTSTAWRDVDAGEVVPAEDTNIHRFELGTAPAYKGSGTAPGIVRREFGLSEHEGHLRVASHRWEGTSEAFVTVLRIDADALTEVGRVGGIGKGEQLFGVRWVGPLGFLVTFLQIDPLHVIDVRDPANPVVAGELEVPGFSTYLHPVGDGLLLGVGRDATSDGRVRGAQVSLFDVRDPARPTRLDADPLSEADHSSTPVDHDYHAFLWWAQRSLAFVPLVESYPPEQSGDTPHAGRIETSFVAVRLGGGLLAEAGRLTPHGTVPASSPERAVIVGDLAIGVFASGVRVASLDTFEPRAWVPFDE